MTFFLSSLEMFETFSAPSTLKFYKYECWCGPVCTHCSGTKWDPSVWNRRFYIFGQVSWIIPFTISFPPRCPSPFSLSKLFLFSCCTFWTSSLIFLAFNSQVPSSHFFVLLLGIFPWIYLANILFNFKKFSASKFFIFPGVSYSVIHFLS